MQSVKMGFVEAVKTCFSKVFTFTGRARRSEYWYWALFAFLVSILFSILTEVIPEDRNDLWLFFFGVYGVWALFNFFASFAVGVRRLHDIGRSGWWYGAQIIFGFVWTFVMLIWLCVIVYRADVDGIDVGSTITPFIPWLIVSGITALPFFIYCVVLLVWACTDSTPGANKYGANPKGLEVEHTCAPSIEEVDVFETKEETPSL